MSSGIYSERGGAVAPDPVAVALAEDVGAGDLTAGHFVPPDALAAAVVVAREPCVLAGVDEARRAFELIDAELAVDARANGESVAAGGSAVRVSGRARSILTAERTALNFLQRLSGIATLTRRFVEVVRGVNPACRVLDTRKTTPGLRLAEKAAVAAGGGHNHRLGLHDMVMVKDNHLLAAGSERDLAADVRAFKRVCPDVRVEIEADTLDQVRRFLAIDGVDIILLDNMTPSEMGEAVALGGGRVAFEASGGVTLDTVAAIAATGVDFISVGALTHSARAVDFSLEIGPS